MKIGFPNNPWKNLLKEIDWIGKNRFDFVDLFLEEDFAVPEKINVVKLKNQLRKHNLSTTGHLAWYLPIGSSIKELRDSSVDIAEKYFKIYSLLGTEYVTIHANWPSGGFSTSKGINFQIYTLKKLVNLAKKYNLKIMYEPIDGKKDTLSVSEVILKKVPGLYFHLDIGHANLYGKNPVSFIKRFHKRLVHIHLHDNSGKKDEHKPIGKGNINFKKIIKELRKVRYDKTITLEIFSKNKKLVLESKRKLEKLLQMP